MQNLQPWLISWQDPTKISTTVKGAVLTVSSMIILIGSIVFHVQISSNDVVTFATEIGTIAGAIATLYGGLMKIVVLIGTIRTESTTSTTN